MSKSSNFTDKPTDQVPSSYPPSGNTEDTTSEGGYGGHAFAPAAQRGLIDQSTEGMPLGNEMQDAYQGNDAEAGEAHKHEQKIQGQGLNPYAGDSFETRKDAEDAFASAYADARARQYESGASASGDQDGGAQ